MPRSSEFFDAEWYPEFYSDVAIDGMSSFEHYSIHGAKEGRDPSADFSTTAYSYLHGVPLEDCLRDFEVRKSRNEEININIIDGLVSNTGEAIAFFFHQSGIRFYGAELSFLNIIKSYCKDGFDITVFLPSIGSVEYVEEIKRYSGRIIVTSYGWLNTPPAAEGKCVNRIRYFLGKINPKKVFVNTSVIFAPVAAAKFFNIPTRMYVHELLPEDLELCEKIGRTPEQVRMSIISDVDEVVPNSFEVASWLDTDRINCIQYPTVEASLFSLPIKQLQLKSGDALTVAIVSDNSPKKGLHDFIALARFFEFENEDLQFKIFGPRNEWVENLISNISNIKLIEYVSNVYDIYSNTDIVLNLSKCGESFGRTMLEGMAAGKTCIAYERGALREVIGSNDCGYLIKPDDLSEVIEILQNVYNHPNNMADIGEKARIRALKINGKMFPYGT